MNAEARGTAPVRLRSMAIMVLCLFVSGCGASPPQATLQPGSSPAGASGNAASAAESVTAAIGEQPSARGYHVLVTAGERGILLIGGFTLHDITVTEHGFPVPGQDHPGRTPDGLWTFDESIGWTYLPPSPDVFDTDQVSDASYDPASDRVVMHLTDRRDPTTRLLDPATGDISVADAEGPTGLVGPMLAYDAGSERVILAGGLGGGPATWAYDGSADTWTRMRPESAPGTRNYAAMDYDPLADRVIVFSGGDPVPVPDTWAYDYDTDTWTELEPARAPAARYYSQMVYDPIGERMIMFGGILATVSSEPDEPGWAYDSTLEEWHRAAGDTWAYDFATNTWTEIVTEAAPSPRGWHAMAYDERTGHIVLFGGGPSRSSFTDETWIFDPVGEVWLEYEE